MGVGSLRFLRFLGPWLTAARGTRPLRESRRSGCELSLSGLRMVRSPRKFRRCSPLRQHEPVGFREGAPSFGGAIADRLAYKTGSSRFTPHSIASWLARHYFRLSHGEEIGPRMLARIAKKTGLAPHDL